MDCCRYGLLVVVLVGLVSVARASSYPKPTALPPHSWDTVGNKVFLHGCKREGPLNDTELAFAAKYPLLTIEKGQGEELPGFAEQKMAQVSLAYKKLRPDGWTLFYINAVKDWNMFHMHEIMENNPTYWALSDDGSPCLTRGDPTFPQPKGGMLTFNMSDAGARAMFISECLNATTSEGGDFNGCFIDSARSWGNATYLDNIARGNCEISAERRRVLAQGEITMLQEMQSAVTSNRMVVAKDGSGQYGDAANVNTVFLSDTFCSCYSCTWGQEEIAACSAALTGASQVGKRGQVVLMHGEVNGSPTANSTQEFEFTLAAFLTAAYDSSFFGFSNHWYFNGSRWWDEYDRPLEVLKYVHTGAPLSDRILVNGTEDAGVWTRSFSSGVNVTLDVVNHVSQIVWS